MKGSYIMGYTVDDHGYVPSPGAYCPTVKDVIAYLSTLDPDLECYEAWSGESLFVEFDSAHTVFGNIDFPNRLSFGGTKAGGVPCDYDNGGCGQSRESHLYAE